MERIDFSEKTNEAQELWKNFLTGLDDNVQKTAAIYFEPMVPLAIQDGVMTLAVDSPFMQDWILGNYANFIQDGLSKLYQAPIRIELIYKPELHEQQLSATKVSKSPTPKADEDQTAAAPINTAVNEDKAPTRNSRAFKDETEKAQAINGRVFKKEYNFNTFITGSSNQLAAAAARAVAEKPGERYNPLYIYGGVGLGKTHLLHAIGQFIHHNRPKARIVYCTAEEFVTEVISAIAERKMDSFVRKYRNGCDVLLMDDIQLISGKDRCQTELFHIFNALYEAGKQIVVTSDKLPHEIPDLAERLRSRFQCGLLADIQSPELETRVAILQQKAKAENFKLPTEVAFYVAKTLPANVRQLEGALMSLMAHATLTGRPLTTDYAKQILANVITTKEEALSVNDIQQAVSEYYHLDPQMLSSKSRAKIVAHPRQVAMYLCRKHINSSYPTIAKNFKRKNHTTVLSACKKIEALIGKSDEEILAEIHSIEKSLQR